MTINMSPEHWEIVKNILKKHPYTFYAYGSRTRDTAKRLSDLDLCYKDTIPDHRVNLIAGEFEDSNLPFTVDLAYWGHLSDDFKALIEPDLIKLNTE